MPVPTATAATAAATAATAATPAPTRARPAHLSSASDNWPTPLDFFAALDAEFGFVLDVCASVGNAKAGSFYALDHPDAERRDGLAGDWAADAAELGGAVWMNPPYGRPIAAWMGKAFATAQAGATVVTLVPVRADTAWWHQFVPATGAEVRFVRGRLTFGDAVNTAAFASAVVISRPTDRVGAPGAVATMPARPEAAGPTSPARPAVRPAELAEQPAETPAGPAPSERMRPTPAGLSSAGRAVSHRRSPSGARPRDRRARRDPVGVTATSRRRQPGSRRPTTGRQTFSPRGLDCICCRVDHRGSVERLFEPARREGRTRQHHRSTP